MITPHQDYVNRRLPPGNTYATHTLARDAATKADAALNELTIALAQINLDAYTKSLDYSLDPRPTIDGLIEALQLNRQHLTRALTAANVAVDDFGVDPDDPFSGLG